MLSAAVGADTDSDDAVAFAFVIDEEVDMVDKDEDDCGMGKLGDSVAAVTVSGASGKPIYRM